MRVPKKPAQSVRPQILCVDDSKHVRSMYKSTLQKNGFKVYTASNGRAALKLVPSRRFSLVVIDQRMPGLMGDQVAEKLRHKRPTLPIVMISGTCELTPAVEKVTMFLAKPVQPEKLIAIVRSLTEK